MLHFGNFEMLSTVEQKSAVDYMDHALLRDKRADAIDVTADEFEAETQHMPNSMYDVDDELHVTDDNGNVYMIDGRLLPNIEYTLNGYTYQTDDYGRIVKVSGDASLNPENERDHDAQVKVGGDDRRVNDQGGHVISREMNGDGGLGNLVAMDSRINQSDYKRMETDIRNALNEGKDVSVGVDVEYDDDSERPSIITATVNVDGEKTVYHFDNNLDGGLKQDVPENGKEIVDTVINHTGGEVSSIKEVYNENGDLVKTVVTVTYQDENGNNRRLPVTVSPN